MANDLITLQKEISDRLHLDMSNASKFTRWANIIQMDIASRYPFDYLMTNTFIQTAVDITAGTVTTVAGSTSVTGSGTSFTTANAANNYIQFQNDTNWYQVSSVSGGVLTLHDPAVNSGSGLTYTLRTTYYDLPGNVYKVFDVRQTNTPLKLTCLGIYTLDEYQPDINVTSNPTGYFLFGLDQTDPVTSRRNIQIAFFPVPDAKYNIQVRFFINPTDLSSSADVPAMPPEYFNVLLDGTEWLGYKFMKDPREEIAKKSYEFGIQKMIEMENSNGDYFPVLQSSDVQSNTSRFLPMPGNYPDVTAGDF